MEINLHIERLIIDEGLVEPHRRGSLHRAVVTELTRLLGDAGSLDTLRGLQSDTAMRYLKAKPITVSKGPAEHTIGTQVAGSVLGSIQSTVGNKQ